MDSFVIAGCTNSRAGKGSSNGILGLLVKDFGLGWGEVQFEAVRNRIWDADSRRRGRMKPSYDVFVLHPGISFRWELEWGGACNGKLWQETEMRRAEGEGESDKEHDGSGLEKQRGGRRMVTLHDWK